MAGGRIFTYPRIAKWIGKGVFTAFGSVLFYAAVIYGLYEWNKHSNFFGKNKEKVASTPSSDGGSLQKAVDHRTSFLRVANNNEHFFCGAGVQR